MKKFSKILSILLCLTLVLGLAAVVGAEEPASATISFDSTDNRTVLNNNQQVWVQNGITVTNDKESSTTNVADYSKPARFYAGSKLTIAYAGMTSIEVACNSTTYATELKNSISDSSVTVDLNQKVVTITFTTAVDSFVIASLSKQVRVDSITVYAGSTGGEHTHTYNSTPDGAATVVDGVNHSYSYTCTDSSCDNVKTETEAHTFGADGKCTVCKFEYTGISQILTAKAGSWTATGVVTFVSGKNVYIQDSTGGICLYCSAAPTDISVGDVVTGTGSYKLFKGLPELENVASVTKVTGSDLKLTPKATTIGALTEADICTYVKIEGATVTAIEGDYTTIKQGENTINIYKAAAASALKVGDTLNLTVAVGCFNDLQLVNCKDSEIVVTNANPGEGEENPPKTSYTGTLLSGLKDGDEVVIYSDYLKGLMTYEDSVYNDKHQLKSISAAVADGKVSYNDGAIVLTVHVKDNVYSFTTPSGLYLYVDGTHTMFVSEAGENTQFVLEQAEGGFYVKCANATYNDKPQYLEAYKGVFTTFGMNENNAAQYVFQFYAADPETPRTGDTSLSMLVALMAVSALGIVVVTSKKKEF